jgi:hypothetical protein
LEGAAFRLLRAPVERVEQPPDVVGVVPNPEVPADKLGHARGRPEIGAVSLGQRTLQEQADEVLPLAGG